MVLPDLPLPRENEDVSQNVRVDIGDKIGLKNFELCQQQLKGLNSREKRRPLAMFHRSIKKIKKLGTKDLPYA
jgi:hypothetical protein